MTRRLCHYRGNKTPICHSIEAPEDDVPKEYLENSYKSRQRRIGSCLSGDDRLHARVIIFQVRSLPALAMTYDCSLGWWSCPILLIFRQPFA